MIFSFTVSLLFLFVNGGELWLMMVDSGLRWPKMMNGCCCWGGAGVSKLSFCSVLVTDGEMAGFLVADNRMWWSEKWLVVVCWSEQWLRVVVIMLMLVLLKQVFGELWWCRPRAGKVMKVSVMTVGSCRKVFLGGCFASRIGCLGWFWWLWWCLRCCSRCLGSCGRCRPIESEGSFLVGFFSFSAPPLVNDSGKVFIGMS